MYTVSQLLAHLIGDYFLQSDWMANNKQRSDLTGWVSVTIHAVTYTLPFLLLTQSWLALTTICVTHLLIDHYKLAAPVCWAKNFFAPRSWLVQHHNNSWKQCKATGSPPERPPFLSVWLLIIMDNTMHLIINGVAIHYL
jgi:hypothetical protein